eukprot:1008690-Pyramimonas_sp.AAC.1
MQACGGRCEEPASGRCADATTGGRSDGVIMAMLCDDETTPTNVASMTRVTGHGNVHKVDAHMLHILHTHTHTEGTLGTRMVSCSDEAVGHCECDV